MIAEGTQVAGRYRLERLLARGGMADVYEAVDVQLERDVAVKVLHRAVEAPQVVDELVATGALTHGAVVRVFDVGLHDERSFLVLELVRGPSLRQRLADGPLPPRIVARLGSRIAAALAHAHSRGIVHRDVKPANILLADDGMPRLADFGIAACAQLAGDTAPLTLAAAPEALSDAEATTLPSGAVGTAGYLPPERVSGEEGGAAGDVYALGLVVLEALTGRREFTGPPRDAALERLSRDPVVPASLGAEWSRLLEEMTAREPAQRPSAAQAAQRLGELERLSTPRPPVEKTAPRRRWRAPAAAAALAGAAILGAGSLLTATEEVERDVIRVASVPDRAETDLALQPPSGHGQPPPRPDRWANPGLF